MAEPVEDLNLVDAVVQLSFAVHEILGSLAAEYDLSIPQVRMLGIVRDRRLGMLELARAMSLEKSSVSGLVDRAEQRGLVARTRSPTDGRAIHVQLTAAGRAATKRFEAQLGERIVELARPLSAHEQAQLTNALSRAVHGYRATKGALS